MAEPAATDDELLRRFVRHGDRQAIDQLIGRHVDFVYASARRQVKDAHLAEDVTQAVFLLLTQKARSIPADRLVGWLFKATRYSAANAKKIRARRDYHEQRAALQKGETVMPEEPFEPDPMLDQLDDALASLGTTDREALMLRYLQGREVADISMALQMSEGTCRRRLSRAVEKLRKFFASSEGKAFEAGAVVTLLNVAAAEKAPAGLIATTACASAASIAAAASTSMLLVKLKIVAGIVIIAALAATGAQLARQPGLQVASPTTAPALEQDPRAVLRAFSRAIENGDLKAARELAVGTEADLAMVDALASVALAGQSFNRVLDERFGPGSNLNATGLDGMEANADAAAVTINADRAELRLVDSGPFMNLRRVDGRWRIDVAILMRTSQWRSMLALANAMTKSIEQISTEVTGGLHPTREAALAALEQHSNDTFRNAIAAGDAKGGSIKMNLRPTTQAVVDGPKPREVIKAFAEAIRSGNSQAARALAAGSEGELAIIDIFSSTMAAQIQLNRAVEEKFGATPGPLVDLRILAVWARAADAMLLIEKGDIAELPSRDGDIALRLRVIDGRWQVDLAVLNSPTTTGTLEAAKARREAFDQIRQRIKSGELSTRVAAATALEEMTHAWRRRVFATESPIEIGMTINASGPPANMEGPDPRDVQRQFAVHILNGNAPAARALVAGSESELAVIDQLARSSIVQLRLNHLLDAKFGREISPPLRNEMIRNLGIRAGAGFLRIDADQALKFDPDGTAALRFVPVDNRWRIDIATIVKGVGQEEMTLQPAMVRATEEVIDQIERGGYLTRQGAHLGMGFALRDARFRALDGKMAPTTGPYAELDLPPREAVKYFAMAISNGEWSLARVLSTGNEDELAMVDAMAAISRARLKLNALAAEKFPSSKRLMNFDIVGDWPARAAVAELRIEGDTAEMRTKPDNPPMRLKRLDGRWRVDLSSLNTNSREAADVANAIAQFMNRLHADVEAGKFQNREQILEELNRTMPTFQAQAAATTNPSTMPTTMP